MGSGCLGSTRKWVSTHMKKKARLVVPGAAPGTTAEGQAAGSSNPDLPSKQDFLCFFLYLSYDTIGEKHGDKVDQLYRNFVQRNRNCAWAKEILLSMERVQNARDRYKDLLQLLHTSSSSTQNIYKVCVDICNANMPPHKEVCAHLS